MVHTRSGQLPVLSFIVLFSAACASAPPPPAAPPDPCAMLDASIPGPLADERAKAKAEPLKVADLFIQEARQTGDAGFYTLAETATTCVLQKNPGDLDARREQAFLWYQFHRFKDVETEARALLAAGGTPDDQMLLGDALMEQGRLDDAANAYQAAVNAAPGLDSYLRVAWLRWLWGDLDGAIDLDTTAIKAASDADPSARAFALTDLGWFHALQGKPAPELDEAVVLDPHNFRAHLLRGRARISAGDLGGAKEDAALAGKTWEAARLQVELDPTLSLGAFCDRDPRGCACWKADIEASAAVTLLDQELANRQDATTRMCHAYALFKAGKDGKKEAQDALATGTRDPEILLMGGLVLSDPAPVRIALSMGPGLLPSEQRRAKAALVEKTP